MNISLKRRIAYTQNWKNTLVIAGLLGSLISFIIIFLEPFDSSGFETSFKFVKLSGYGIWVLTCILLLHIFENYFYRRNNRKWLLYQEIISLLTGFFLILVCCFFHNFYVVNSLSGFSLSYFTGFLQYIGLPFGPLILPLWAYLRYKSGKIEVSSLHNSAETIQIQGDNKSENFSLLSTQFLYAQAQQNYVLVVYLENEQVTQKMIRSTLSGIEEQIPTAQRVHRSYLANLDRVHKVEGNSRKRKLVFNTAAEAIPITQKYYESLQNRLAISSQTL